MMNPEEIEEELAALRSAANEMEWLFAALDKLVEMLLLVNAEKANTMANKLTLILEEWQFTRRPLDCRAARLLITWRDLADSLGRLEDPAGAALLARNRIRLVPAHTDQTAADHVPSRDASPGSVPPAPSPGSLGRPDDEPRD